MFGLPNSTDKTAEETGAAGLPLLPSGVFVLKYDFSVLKSKHEIQHSIPETHKYRTNQRERGTKKDGHPESDQDGNWFFNKAFKTV